MKQNRHKCLTILESLTQSCFFLLFFFTVCLSDRIENKRRLQTLSIDNAWSNKNFLYHLTFRMLQHTSSEVNGYNYYKHHVKNTKLIKRGSGDKIKNNDEIDTTDS